MFIFSNGMIGHHNIICTSKVYLKPVCLNVKAQRPHEVQELFDIGHRGEGALARVEKLYNRLDNLYRNISENELNLNNLQSFNYYQQFNFPHQFLPF